MFEHQWALTLLDHVLTVLRNEHAAAGKTDVYGALKGFLHGDGEATYREVGGRLAMTETAVKTAVHRLRKRFGELLRQEITRTVANSDDVEDEVRSLFNALKGH
jgi:RNA polymerase sigma-70 factor (ECF subfamily)